MYTKVKFAQRFSQYYNCVVECCFDIKSSQNSIRNLTFFFLFFVNSLSPPIPPIRTPLEYVTQIRRVLII